MDNRFDKNKFYEKLLIFSWVVFLFICIGLLSFTSHAEEAAYFPMQQNENNHFTDGMLSAIDSQFDSENNYTFAYTYSFAYGEFYCYALYFPKNNTDPFIYGEINNAGNSFSLYPIQNVTLMKFSINPNTNVIRTYPTAGTNAGNYQNMPSSQYNTSYGYVSNFKIYTTSAKTSVVLKYGSDDPLPVEQGHATAPDPFEDPVLATGSNHTLPREVPESPTINNYTWTTYNNPTVDTTNIESLLESIFDILSYNAGYLKTNISNEFDNLNNNVKGFFDYIGNTIQYYGGLIISNIQNGIETFYNNMVSLFEPISAKIDYLTEPVDGTIIYDNISSTSLVTNINSINTSLTAFQTSFSNLSEPSSFTIPIHLENLPSAYFGNQTTQYIDLGVIGSTEKTLIRTFMWALITYGLFITIVDSVSNYINGGGDES